MISLGLIASAFFAGLLTFLAPCTLPLVPGYLGFISGVSQKDLRDPTQLEKIRPKVFWNGFLYVLGFSVVFIFLGSVFGFTGSAFGAYRPWLLRASGLFVIFFGLFMMNLFDAPFLNALRVERHLRIPGFVFRPGNPLSSFIFGAAFAVGWTRCVGPILGTVLTLAATSATAAQGAFLLFVFSVGLGLPFLLMAYFVSSAMRWLARVFPYINTISFIGGLLLVVLGVLIFTDQMGIWNGYFYRLFQGIDYNALMDHL